MRRLSRPLAGLAIALAALAPPGFASTPMPSAVDEARDRLSALHLPFLANQGEVDERVAYYARTPAGTLFVTHQGEVVHGLSGLRIDPRREARPASRAAGWSLTETLVGGHPRPAGRDRGITNVSTFLGSDRGRWRASLPTWERVSLGEVWPGVSVALQAHSGEKVFTVSPGGDVSRIRMRVAGARSLAVDVDGALVAGTGLGPVTFTAPIAYQERGGVRQPVAVAYRLRGSEYGFTVGAYDRALPLVIDPLLQATYLGGGNFEAVRAIAIHPTTGDVYAAGSTSSDPFPGTAGGAQPAFAGAGGLDDAFVARFSSDLTTLLQATYLGGPGFDRAHAIAIHPTSGDVYVAGSVGASPFPGTAGGAQPDFGGSTNPFGGDAFVARFPSSLTSLTQSTYLGTAGNEIALAVAIHPATGDVYVAGSGGAIPGTAGGAQPAPGGGSSDGFVARLAGTLTSLIQGTFLGGSAHDTASALAIHPASGDVYVAGPTGSSNFPGTAGGAQPTFGGSSLDGFVTRLTSTLTSLVQSSFLGGTGLDEPQGLAIHPTTGDVYLTGLTTSANFPGTAGGAQPTLGGGNDVFVSRLALPLDSIMQSTFLGGSADEVGTELAIHPATGDVYVAGRTAGSLPGTTGGAQPAFGGGSLDAFVARLSGTLTSLGQATYAGGCGGDLGGALAIHPASGDVYLAGETGSDNLPLAAGGAQSALAGNSDGFLAWLTSGLDAPAPGAAGAPCLDLTIAKTHSGDFVRGSTGNSYTVTVSNVGPGDKIAGQEVTVTDAPPSGLTVTAMSGAGWTCTTLPTCTRNDVLAAGGSYPPITVTASVSPDATSPQDNVVLVSSPQPERDPGNNQAVDSTVITGGAAQEIPTLSEWAVAALAMLLAALALLHLHGSRAP